MNSCQKETISRWKAVVSSASFKLIEFKLKILNITAKEIGITERQCLDRKIYYKDEKLLGIKSNRKILSFKEILYVQKFGSFEGHNEASITDESNIG